ncbi:UDP-glucose/GDP-mannose dehydrogenase family, NAD binding domain-containing protein [Delphinella strobiligena]|nr:UDP-glucose/GDP-mannose dehydrogenase family, NAD binding domain-containing protein [Delphinella strobiligena]
MTVKSVTFIGAGFVGAPSGAVLALKNPHVEVNVVDLSEARIAGAKSAWNSEKLPLYEPGLPEVLKEARDGKSRQQNLFFSTDVRGAIKRADIVFVCVNTPTKTAGTGAGRAPNLSYFESATRMIAAEAENDKIVVEKSTVPCRTADTMREVLEKTGRPGVRFDILSNPEFLAEGTTIPDLLNPDRILIGSLPSGAKAAAALENLYASWVPRERILQMNLWSSELAKLAANAILAQRISSINALSAVCEATGADISEIARAAGSDSRIGSRMLQASVGFGGSCFRKDVLSLAYMAESLHLPEVADYWQSVVSINEWQKDRFAKRIIRCLYNNVSNKKIGIFGFAYKKNTSDTRESAAISVVKNLVAEQARVSIYDPQVTKAQIWEELQMSGCQDFEDYVTVCTTPYDAAEDAHAVVILTEWDEFSNKDRASAPSPTRSEAEDSAVELSTKAGALRQDSVFDTTSRTERSRATSVLDWSRVMGLMQKPAFVFDGRRIVDVKKLEQLGFHVESIGRGSS